MPHAWPTLNWKEIELFAHALAPEIVGLFVERLVVPARPLFHASSQGGYLKGEWVLRLTGPGREFALWVSVRPRHPLLALKRGRGPQAATQATHAPFDLALSKFLKGARVTGLEVPPRERMVVLNFAKEGLRLALSLIPATPEALLIGPEAAILARSRGATGESGETFSPPTGERAPPSPEVRHPLVADAFALWGAAERALDDEAFETRLLAADKALRERLKLARTRLRQAEASLEEAAREPDWRRLGELLKHSLDAPADAKGRRRVTDYETGAEVEIPGDPKLEARAQAEKFFQNARRKQRRVEEGSARAATFRETAGACEALLAAPPAPGDFEALERREREAGIGAPESAGNAKKSRGKSGWFGKAFTSKDGLPIWVGRSRDENLELTFKHARGNDVWLHLRGRPGAHVVIPMPAGKSPPLETLLDAATLVLHYSGGASWGKTEVDYTYKKYVKRIKNSTEASYTNNKTLIVAPDAERARRLLGGEKA